MIRLCSILCLTGLYWVVTGFIHVSSRALDATHTHSHTQTNVERDGWNLEEYRCDLFVP